MSKVNIIKTLAQSPDSAWQMMESLGITLFELLEEPAQKLDKAGLRRIAELTAEKIHGSNTINRQICYQELCKSIDEHFGTVSSPLKNKIASQPTAHQNKAQSKSQLLQTIYNQAQQANKQPQGSSNNPFPNTQPSVLMQGGVNAAKNLSRPLSAPAGQGAKIITRFFLVNIDYLKRQFWHDLTHHLGHTIIVMIAALFFGLIFSALVNSIFLINGWLSVFPYTKHLFAYLGMVNAWNFYLYKHRGY